MNHFSRGRLIGGSKKKRRKRGRQDSERVKRAAEDISGGIESEVAAQYGPDIDTLRLGLGEKRSRADVEVRAQKYGEPGSLSKVRGMPLRTGQLSAEDRGPMKRFRTSLPPAILSAQAAAGRREEAQLGTSADRDDDGAGHVGGTGAEEYTHAMKREEIEANEPGYFDVAPELPDAPAMAMQASNVPTASAAPADVDQAAVGGGTDFDDFVDLENDPVHEKGTTMLHDIGDFGHEAPEDAYHLTSTSGRHEDSVSHAQHDVHIRGNSQQDDEADRSQYPAQLDPFAGPQAPQGRSDPAFTEHVFGSGDVDMPQNTTAAMQDALSDINLSYRHAPRMALRGGASSGAPVPGLPGAGGIPPLGLPAHTMPALGPGQ